MNNNEIKIGDRCLIVGMSSKPGTMAHKVNNSMCTIESNLTDPPDWVQKLCAIAGAKADPAYLCAIDALNGGEQFIQAKHLIKIPPEGVPDERTESRRPVAT